MVSGIDDQDTEDLWVGAPDPNHRGPVGHSLPRDPTINVRRPLMARDEANRCGRSQL